MKKIFLFFLALPLFGAKLINYNIYDRNDRVDVMLSFDSAYNGNISQKTEKNFTLLTLSELSFPKEELKNLNSSLVDKIQISSKNDKTYIMFQNKAKVSLDISSINDKFGVRIRVTSENLNRNLNSNPNPNQNLNQNVNQNSPVASASILNTNADSKELKSKNSSLEGFNYTQYILVMLVLVLILIALWWFKRTMNQKGFINSKNFNVAFQRPLDKNNQFMILEYKNKRYVMIIGSSNVLLESVEFTEDELNRKDEFDKKEENFDSVFEENKRKIQNLIQKRQKN